MFLLNKRSGCLEDFYYFCKRHEKYYCLILKKMVMKRFIIILLFVTMAPSAFAINIPISDTHIINYLAKVKGGIELCIWGDLGNYNIGLNLNGLTGTIDYSNGNTSFTRKLKVQSYNERTGKLHIKEYNMSGKYTGQFMGTYKHVTHSEFWELNYSGVYTNAKGKKIRFDLSFYS